MSTPELGRMTSQNRKEKPRDGLSRGRILILRKDTYRKAKVHQCTVRKIHHVKYFL